jgi:hypothetical protein
LRPTCPHFLNQSAASTGGIVKKSGAIKKSFCRPFLLQVKQKKKRFAEESVAT